MGEGERKVLLGSRGGYVVLCCGVMYCVMLYVVL